MLPRKNLLGKMKSSSNLERDARMANSWSDAKAAFIASLKLATLACGALPTSIPKAIFESIGEITSGLQRAADNAKTAEEMQTNLRVFSDGLQATVSASQSYPLNPELRKQVDILTSFLSDTYNNAFPPKRKLWSAFIHKDDDAALLDAIAKKQVEVMNQFQTQGIFELQRDMTEVANDVRTVKRGVSDINKHVIDVKSLQILESLRRAKGADYRGAQGSGKARCFEGTREAILDEIKIWMRDTEASTQRIFWVEGIAGIGKTTIAITVAVNANVENLYCASFFISARGDSDLSDPRLLLPTLAYQLARADPLYCQALTEILAEEADLDLWAPQDQVTKLFIDPMKGLKWTREPVLLILDALDECREGVKDVVKLLFLAVVQAPSVLKILVTTRPDPFISSTLVSQVQLNKCIMHRDIETNVVQGDIERYLRSRLHQIPEEIGWIAPSQATWFTEAQVGELAQKCGILFIYAFTATCIIGDRGVGDPAQQLKALLESGLPQDSEPYEELDRLYLGVLDAAFKSRNKPFVVARFQRVVGALVVQRDTLSVATMSLLLDIPNKDIVAALSSLQSVISTDGGTPLIYHQSFREFLTDQNRCCRPDRKSHPGYISTEVHDKQLAIRCLQLVTTSLHSLSRESLKTPSSIPLHLAYCCRYWSTHTCNVQTQDSNILKLLKTFFSTTFLRWLEVMSTLGLSPEGTTALRLSESWAKRLKCPEELLEILHDAHRFMLTFITPIRVGPEMVCDSALPFCPRGTRLWQIYQDTTSRSKVEVLAGYSSLKWSSCLSTLYGHASTVLVVAYSPDGSRIVSGSLDSTVRVWDAVSGVEIAALQGHTHPVRTVTFSPDGTRVLSGSEDSTVRVWDPSGVELATLRGHTEEIRIVKFSPNGSRLASGSRDSSVRVWDMTSGVEWLTLRGHTNWVSTIAYSPDGSRLASGSDDRTVRIWDTESGVEAATLRGHEEWIRTVTFSPDGSWLASGSDDSTVRVWDAQSGAGIAKLDGHTGWVTTIAFSPNGSRLASGSWDSTVRLWDTKTWTEAETLRRNTGPVTTVVFSPDGSRLALASHDNPVRIWNIASREMMTLRGHTRWVMTIAFSPDGLQLASGSDDSTLRVWDVASGEPESEEGGPPRHEDLVSRVTFSPDGSQVASETETEEWTVLDIASGVFVEGAPVFRFPSDHSPIVPNRKLHAHVHQSWLVAGWGSADEAARVCHIPAEYTPSSRVAVSGQLVAWGCRNGKLLLIRLNLP